MTFDEYMIRFRLVQRETEQEEKRLNLLKGKAYQRFSKCFSQTENPLLSALVLSAQKVEKRWKHKQRLCERYGERIARAIDLIESPVLREYALCRYLYGLTHEEIAEQSFYCVRTVYRHGKAAKKELEKALLSLMPHVKRTKAGRFHVLRGRLPRVKKKSDRFSYSASLFTARRNSLAYRPFPAYI